MKRYIGIALLAGAVTGCIPWPHLQYRAPSVDGIIKNNGVPVQNAEIIVSAEYSSEQQRAVSDINGHFNTKPIRELTIMAPIMGDPTYGYAVEIKWAGNKFVGIREFYVGYAPKNLEVSCDLSRPTGLGNQMQYCLGQGNE